MAEKEKPKKKKHLAPKKPNQKRVEIFASAVVAGKSQTDAYKAAYPSSLKWQPKSVWSAASLMSDNAIVMQRIDELRKDVKKEIVKEFSWGFLKSLKSLGRIVLEKKSKDTDKIRAVKEMNLMLGLHSATKLDHSSKDGSMSNKPLFDVTKLSSNTMKEILEAKDAAENDD